MKAVMGYDAKIQREAESRKPSRLPLDARMCYAGAILCRNVEAPFIQSAISSQILICCWESRAGPELLINSTNN